MKAQEMFEELGYELLCQTEQWICYGNKREDDCFIQFYKKNKTFFCQSCYEPIDIDMPLLKAINKQCEELGWLDE